MWTVIDTPIGELRLVASVMALKAIQFTPFGDLPVGETDEPAQTEAAHPTGVLQETARQLSEYFAGERTVFDLPLEPRGTEFQHQVWDQLVQVAFGETATYGQIAHRLGRTNAASRAVGLANGRNPIPVVIPCHRVIGADGTLTGYAGGLDRKRILLALEGRVEEESLF